MKNGGYFILDLKGKDRKSMEGITEDDIYDTIESNRKAVMVSGLVIDGKEFPDFFAKPHIDGTAFVIEVNEYYDIAIRDTDVVFIRGDFNIGSVLGGGSDSEVIEGLSEKWENAKTISGTSNADHMYHIKNRKIKTGDGMYLVFGNVEDQSFQYEVPDIAQFVVHNDRYIIVDRLGRDEYVVG